MDNHIKLELKPENQKYLREFSEILGKDINTIFNEALERYFEAEQKKIVEQSIIEDGKETKLSYDEFWDGLDDI
ncbi:MAG TPA: hypothetical protein ENK86_03775 [Campylobacterales bacterium]|nr:hypothetical protein [Campylobacterales bacterium]